MCTTHLVPDELLGVVHGWELESTAVVRVGEPSHPQVLPTSQKNNKSINK
jgi:hypothetical protein